MPSKIKPKRSYTANAVPTTSDLETNELAIRWDSSSPAIFTKNAAGNIVSISLSGGGGGGSANIVEAATTAGFPATGASGTLYIATDASRVYRWASSVYVEIGTSGGGAGGDGTDSVLRALFVPGAPTSVTAAAGNTQATVSWTAPAGVISQAPITDYVVQFSSNSGSTWTTFSDGTSTSATATVTGLTNGTAYVFRVAAANSLGQGAFSSASSAVTPAAGDIIQTTAGLFARYDASESSTLYGAVSGGSVASADGIVKRWEDRSGNGRHATLQADSINAAYTGPTLRSSFQNGRSTLQFGVDGGGLIGLGLDGVDGMGLTSTGGTIFIVAKVDANNYGAPLAKAQGSYRGWWWQVKHEYGAAFVWQQSGSVFSQQTASQGYNNDFAVIAMSIPTGNLPSSVMYVNGTAVSLSYYASGGGLSVPPSGSDRLTIGYANLGSQSNDLRWKGHICEIALYDQQISSTAIGQISTFLKTKWGIA